MIELDRYTSARHTPSQARSRERIRLILTTALQLFDERGIDRVTTNDIAKAARIPIGSIYRYFENKEEIILAIADFQIADLVKLFKNIAGRPDLAQLGWQDILSQVTEVWAKYFQEHNTFSFFYFLRSSRTLHGRAAVSWQRVGNAYRDILQKRDSRVVGDITRVYVQLTWSAVELALHRGQTLSQQAITILASHLDQKYP